MRTSATRVAGPGAAERLGSGGIPYRRMGYWVPDYAPKETVRDGRTVLTEIRACRASNPGRYVKVNTFDSPRGWEAIRLSFLVQRPADEARYRLVRTDGPGRSVRYAVERQP